MAQKEAAAEAEYRTGRGPGGPPAVAFSPQGLRAACTRKEREGGREREGEGEREKEREREGGREGGREKREGEREREKERACTRPAPPHARGVGLF